MKVGVPSLCLATMRHKVPDGIVKWRLFTLVNGYDLTIHRHLCETGITKPCIVAITL